MSWPDVALIVFDSFAAGFIFGMIVYRGLHTGIWSLWPNPGGKGPVQ